jgi:23S rRNA (cytidine1920-2'-O)/16S rRNA (cytidine1409-2'-O)-methyltransferase
MARKTFREMVEALKASGKELRGSVKLAFAIDGFGVDVTGRVCLDVGASTGGFTSVLLERGAARVYAVDAGHGQLLGSLRQDPRVVNLEATNVGELDGRLVPESVDLVTVDVSYLSLHAAVEQLSRISLAPDAHLVGLVKPMFELRMAEAPTDRATLERATQLAVEHIVASGWDVIATSESPVRGARGAVEGFVHARRPQKRDVE